MLKLCISWIILDQGLLLIVWCECPFRLLEDRSHAQTAACNITYAEEPTDSAFGAVDITMDDDLDELLGDLDILGQAQENDRQMGAFHHENDLDSFGEILGCQNVLADPQILPRTPLEDIRDVEEHRQELFWAVPRDKARINRIATRESDPRKKAKGFLNLSAVDGSTLNATEKLKASKHAPGPKFKPTYIIQDIRRKRKIAQSDVSASTSQIADDSELRVGQKVLKSSARLFRAFNKKEDIQGESTAVVSSTGKVVYVPFGRFGGASSVATVRDHGLLSIPIRKLVEECRNDAKQASQRRMDPERSKPMV